jgi:hypothetical protein
MDCKRLERSVSETNVKVESEVAKVWDSLLATFRAMKSLLCCCLQFYLLCTLESVCFSEISYVISDKNCVACMILQSTGQRTCCNT